MARFTLEDIARMFPEGDRLGPSYSYGPLINALGDAVVEISDDDYQGTTQILLRNKDGQLGIYAYSWGSCSGCDFAQGCTSASEFLDYANDAADCIKWTDALGIEEQLKQMEKDANDWACNGGKDREFIIACRKALSKEAP